MYPSHLYKIGKAIYLSWGNKPGQKKNRLKKPFPRTAPPASSEALVPRHRAQERGGSQTRGAGEAGGTRRCGGPNHLSSLGQQNRKPCFGSPLGWKNKGKPVKGHSQRSSFCKEKILQSFIFEVIFFEHGGFLWLHSVVC